MRSPLGGRGAILGDFGVGMGAALNGPQRSAKRGRVARQTPTQILSPSDQSILTVNTQTNLLASRNAAWTANGVGIGNGSPALAFRPTAVNLAVSLIAGDSASRQFAVAAASNLLGTLTSWTGVNVTATAGFTDYAGGTTAYRIQSTATTAVEHYISRTPSPGNSTTKSSISFIAHAGSAGAMVMVDLRTPSGANVAIYDFATGQSGSNRCWIYPVEDLGGGWLRFWAGVSYGQNVTEARIYVTNTLDYTAAATTTLTTSDYIDVSDVRGVDGVLPYYDKQKGSAFQSGVASVVGATRWKIGTDFYDSGTSWGTGTGAGGLYFEVLTPDTYTTSKTYRYILVNAVELTAPSSFANELQVLKDLNIHNTLDCIIVRPYAARTWGGIKSDGTLNHDAMISALVPRFMEQFYSVGKTRDYRTIMGYSAAGFAALIQLNRHPDVWGYCVAWDSPMSSVYGSIDQANYFGTSAQYDLFNAKLQFTPSAWNDRARLVFGGYHDFLTDTNDMFAVLQKYLGNPINNDGSDYATAVTDDLGRWWKIFKTGGATAHNFLAEWVSPSCTALQYLWNRGGPR